MNKSRVPLLLYVSKRLPSFKKKIVMYADFKKIKLDEVEVKLTHDKVHKKDGESTESAAKIDQIKINLKLEGDLTAEQRKRLVEIAERCPVHRTIKGVPEMIISEMVD